jgi:hypothetical protein
MGLKGQRETIRRRGFFLFASFSFFKASCGNVEKSTGRRVLVTNSRPNQVMVTRRDSSQDEVRERDAHSDVVLRGLDYKGCSFPAGR